MGGEPSVAEFINILVGVAVVVIGWMQLRQAQDVKRLDDRMDKDGQEIKAEINNLGNRFGSRLDSLEGTVVYKDTFGLFKELMAEKHLGITRMMELIQEQNKQAASNNSVEHQRICGRLDAIPQIITEGVQTIADVLKSGGGRS